MKWKNLILGLSLLWISLYVPLAITVYSGSWYEFNYGKQDTYDSIFEEDASEMTDQLITFFLHRGELDERWSESEKIHMSDVRLLYDIAFTLFILSIGGLSRYFDKSVLKRAAKYSIFGVILTLIVVLPVFGWFWSNIFHSVLFFNDYWIVNRNEVSYYLFPLEFFVRSTLFIGIVSVLINIGVYFGVDRLKK